MGKIELSGGKSFSGSSGNEIDTEGSKSGMDSARSGGAAARAGSGGVAIGSRMETVQEWRVKRSALCMELKMEDGSHITCLRFGNGTKKDNLYTAHSAGYITVWRVFIDPSTPNGIGAEQIKQYRDPALLGTFFYNFEIVTDELLTGKAISAVTMNTSDDWIVLNAKDNLIRRISLEMIGSFTFSTRVIEFFTFVEVCTLAA